MLAAARGGGPPDKTTSTQGESFDPAGVQVKAVYADVKRISSRASRVA